MRTTQPNYYAAAYPNGMGSLTRTLRVFKGLATRQAWIAARLTDIPEAPGYRATVQASDITPTERRAINQALSLTITRA